ncbi:transporter substrate-binding domain-containing protein [Roseinatronobacter sp. S2]|uniref:transporter substrate-binding domain-containing protein n=1 Tax=Roseinatronobacter sp. S2 TaxID=3035471 RepID=UPI00240F65C6|nr:transporter substrate-binding domain-containing protein [Roseinatronobacter sp. S2]WFE75805.1 transporter substrate-binding domain-containing protein [Roseinatronobacter sp. S2]
MTKTILSASAALIAGVLSLTAVQADVTDRTIILTTGGAFPPSNMTRPNGDLYGFEIDLANEIAERQGLEIEFISQAWDGMIQGLIDGKYDAVINSISITPVRQDVVDFSLPYTLGGSTFVVMNRAGIELPMDGATADLGEPDSIVPAIDAVADVLHGKTIGVQQATIQSAFLEEYLKDKGVNVRTYPNGPDVYQDLMIGRIDAGIASLTNVSAFLEQNADRAMATGPTFIGGLMGAGAGIAVQKGDDALREAFNAGLESVVADGTLAELSTKWFGLVVTPEQY